MIKYNITKIKSNMADFTPARNADLQRKTGLIGKYE